MKSKGIIFFATALILSVLVLTSASATDVLFADNFEEYVYNQGLDLYAEMEAQGWYIYDYTHPYNDDDITIQTSNPIDAEYVSIRDDSYIRTSIDTSGYENIELSYYRRVFGLGGGDSLEIEWRIGDSGTWETLESVLHDQNTWQYKSWLLSGAEDESEIQIRFRLDNGNDDYGHVDSVLVSGDRYDTEEPDSNVTYVTRDNETDRKNCTYDETTGKWKVFPHYGEDDLIVNGRSEDEESEIDLVQYIRTGWATHWKNAFTRMDNGIEDWYTDPDDYWDEIPEGYKVCGRAKDTADNLENAGLHVDDVEDEGDASDCCWVCVDMTPPGTPNTPEHFDLVARTYDSSWEATEEFGPASGYDDDWDIEFDWNDVEDDPECSGVDYYEVEWQGTSSGSDTTSVSEYAVLHGKSCYGEYQLRARAIDMAGNPGLWSDWSSLIIVDVCYPTVDLIGPTGWQTTNFDVSIDASDAETAVEFCQIRIEDNSVETLPWTTVPCADPYTVQVPTYCATQGTDKCTVEARAVDTAGNVYGDTEHFDIDTIKPYTIKTVGEPKIDWTFEPNWTNWDLQSWFITSSTPITLDCYDDINGTGSQADYINYSVDGVWNQESGNTVTFYVTGEEGMHIVTYYCVDNAGWVEDELAEPDYLDDTPPEAWKNETPLYLEETLDAEGEPENGWDDGNDSLGLYDRCYIWYEDGEDVMNWFIRCVGEWQPGEDAKTVHGVIKTDHTFLEIINPNDYDPSNGMEIGSGGLFEDYWWFNEEDPEIIEFEMNINGQADGFDFVVPEGAYLTFEIDFEDQGLDPELIFLGVEEENPRTDPFGWPETRWVSNHTVFEITADDGEGVGVHSIWYWLFDGLTGMKELWSADGDYTNFTLNCSYPEGSWKIHYWAVDLLENGWDWGPFPPCGYPGKIDHGCLRIPEHIEYAKSQVVVLDKTAPYIDLREPNQYEYEYGCEANIFTVKALIEDLGWDAYGAGVAGAKAELLYEDETPTGRECELDLKQDGYWKCNLNHWDLLAGNYIVRVTAWDNVMNENYVDFPILLTYDVFFGDLSGFTINKGESGGTTFDIKLCHGGNATGMLMTKLCGSIDLTPVLSYGEDNFYVYQESYFEFIMHLFHWQSNPFLPLGNSAEEIGVERTVTLTMTVPEEVQCNSNNIQCRYLGYKLAAAYEPMAGPAEPDSLFGGIGWFDVTCNENSITFGTVTGGFCGNGMLEGGEECDGSAGLTSCEDYLGPAEEGYHWEGALSCTGTCSIEHTCNQVVDSSGGSGGGGGGSSSYYSSESNGGKCVEDWKCMSWGECVEGFRYRTCQDIAGCGTTEEKPAEKQACLDEEANNNGNTFNADANADGTDITGAAVGGKTNPIYGILIAIGIIAIAVIIGILAKKRR